MRVLGDEESQSQPLLLYKDHDEKVVPNSSLTSRESRYPIPSAATLKEKSCWLTLYFVLSLVLTIQNKLVMSQFPYPYTLTGIHALFNCIGITILIGVGTYKPVSISRQQSWNLFRFSILYAINIAVSNASLNLVTVPVHQTIRSLTPIMVVILSIIFLQRRFARKIHLALTTITIGVAIATYGTYGVTAHGLILTLLGAFLAAVKALTASSMLKAPNSNKLSPLDILFYMSPLAILHMSVFALCSGEASKLYEVVWSSSTTEDHGFSTIHILLNGIIASLLNVVSFTTNKKTGAVAISVAGNIKQVLSILLAVFIFDLRVSLTNAVGIFITLIAGAWYAHIEFSLKATTTGCTEPQISSESVDDEKKDSIHSQKM